MQATIIIILIIHHYLYIDIFINITSPFKINIFLSLVLFVVHIQSLDYDGFICELWELGGLLCDDEYLYNKDDNYED